MIRAAAAGALLLSLASTGAARAQAPAAESFRLRLVNSAGGRIEVSADGGERWDVLGKVTRPATATAAASSILTVVPAGSVAGVTRAEITIRVPAAGTQIRSLRILSRQGAPAGSAISTDVSEDDSFFRYLSPPAGSPVLLARGGKEGPLPQNYAPQAGDALVIVVRGRAEPEPATVTIENQAGGEVVLAETGGIPRIVARVKQPLTGIGRYAGTERAGSGSILSWTPTVVLVSTASTIRRLDANDQPLEERGGFVIQPAEPTLRGVTHPPSQLLLESVSEAKVKPPVAAFFGLPFPLSPGDPFDQAPPRVEIRIDEGDWQPLPDLRGGIGAAELPEALQRALGRPVKTGSTHLRFVFGKEAPKNLQRRLLLARTPRADGPPQRGKVTITASVEGSGVTYVSFYLNGILAKVTNQPPYTWDWNTLQLPNGEHLIEIRGLDERGAVVNTVFTRVLVDN